MAPPASPAKLSPDHREVLTKAVLRAADKLALSTADLAGVLGVSVSTVSRLSTTPLAKPKAAELAALFVRIYRSLIGVVGNDVDARKWMTGHNHYLEGRPVDLIQTVEGLVRTLSYLDAMRARV